MPQEGVVAEVLSALDSMEQDVTEWEAGFLDSVMKQSYPVTAKQRTVLVKMAEQYLDPCLAAELRGQERLF